VAIPLIAAAINEDRDVLKQMWAQLLAAAMDPTRTNLVRPSLIELLKRLDPLDASILRDMIERPQYPNQGDLAGDLSQRLRVDRTEAFFSVEHLHELGCLDDSPNRTPVPRVTARAQLLIRAVSD
jgi:hypothetical protein